MMDEKKRKYTVGKNVFLFTNGRFGKKCAGLYEFKISVTKWGDGKYVVDSFYNQGDTLEAIGTFYDERSLPEISSVAACLLGNDLLYLIPHDENIVSPSDLYCYLYEEHLLNLLMKERETLAPCLFDISKKKNKMNLRIESPLARKNEPVLIFIGNKVFALSCPTFVKCPEPCFESLVAFTHNDDDDYDAFCRWTPLECPPFHRQSMMYVSGVVGLEEEGLILVSVVDNKNTSSYFSYNIRSEKWSPVHIGQGEPDEDGFLIPTYLHDNAAVVNNNIYTYFSDYKMLLVLPYTSTVGGDLSLGVISEVQGFELKKKFDDIGDYDYTRSGTVTKVDDLILCLVHTLCPSFRNVQHLCISFVQLVGDGKECTTLKSFTCTLSNGTEFNQQAIKSCFVVNDREEKSDHRSVKRPVMPGDADDKALIEMKARENDTQEAYAM